MSYRHNFLVAIVLYAAVFIIVLYPAKQPRSVCRGWGGGRGALYMNFFETDSNSTLVEQQSFTVWSMTKF